MVADELPEDANWWTVLRWLVAIYGILWHHVQASTSGIWSARWLRWEWRRVASSIHNKAVDSGALIGAILCECNICSFLMGFYINGGNKYYTMSISLVTWCLLWAVMNRWRRDWGTITVNPFLKIVELSLLFHKVYIDLPGFRGQSFVVSEHFTLHVVALAVGFEWKIVIGVTLIQVWGNP